jgi:hypothetical protein
MSLSLADLIRFCGGLDADVAISGLDETEDVDERVVLPEAHGRSPLIAVFVSGEHIVSRTRSSSTYPSETRHLYFWRGNQITTCRSGVDIQPKPSPLLAEDTRGFAEGADENALIREIRVNRG